MRATSRGRMRSGSAAARVMPHYRRGVLRAVGLATGPMRSGNSCNVWHVQPKRRRGIELSDRGDLGGREFQVRLADQQRDHEIVQMKRRHLHEWLQGGTRFLVLANAGGSVATLTFIGTLLDNKGTGYKPAVVCLALFVFGVLFAGVVILGQLRKAWLEELGPEHPPSRTDWLGRQVDRFFEFTSYYHSPLLFCSFAGFAIGALLGIVWLLL